MDSFKSDKVVILFISEGSKFRITGPEYFLDFLPKYSVLIFGTQISDTERNCVVLLSITNMLSKNIDATSCLTLNVSIANC